MPSLENETDNKETLTDIRELIEEKGKETSATEKRTDLTDLRDLLNDVKWTPESEAEAGDEKKEGRSRRSHEVAKRVNRMRRKRYTKTFTFVGAALILGALIQLLVLPYTIQGFLFVGLTLVAGFTSMGIPFLLYGDEDKQNKAD